MLTKHKNSKLISRLESAMVDLDDDFKQDLKLFVSTLQKDVEKAKPAVLKWLIDNVEPAVLTFIDYLINKLK